MNLLFSRTSETSAHDDSASRTALVLGGGGSAGNAWLIGVVAGFSDGGLDVTDADLIIGTSAGSTAAAQITGAAPADLFSATLEVPPVRTAPTGSDRRPPVLTTSHLERFDAIIAASSDMADVRRRTAAAFAEHDVPQQSERWRTTVAARLPHAEWPRQRLQITAVDARTSEPVVFDRDSGIELVDAVAASCAGGFAYRIGEGRYIDGGYRSNADNADLAAGFARVLVLSPLGGRTRTPFAWGTHLATQLDELRAQGSGVETIFPDADALSAFGDDLMDSSTRPAAARAGFAQGRGLAAHLGGFWR
ncbi:patatin-like phospholipase family protein [Microbacterium sp. SS28]|uniref:patatin-like phospholipase family protein n=1 Tax=Microbacterium sp. SS28 TaxID=2919948 RepID=UPI001FA9D138|nr:patatin-like phospholipase family protein [Microbacterium sp. SS28]